MASHDQCPTCFSSSPCEGQIGPPKPTVKPGNRCVRSRAFVPEAYCKSKPCIGLGIAHIPPRQEDGRKDQSAAHQCQDSSPTRVAADVLNILELTSCRLKSNKWKVENVRASELLRVGLFRMQNPPMQFFCELPTMLPARSRPRQKTNELHFAMNPGLF